MRALEAARPGGQVVKLFDARPVVGAINGDADPPLTVGKLRELLAVLPDDMSVTHYDSGDDLWFTEYYIGVHTVRNATDIPKGQMVLVFGLPNDDDMEVKS